MNRHVSVTVYVTISLLVCVNVKFQMSNVDVKVNVIVNVRVNVEHTKGQHREQDEADCHLPNLNLCSCYITCLQYCVSITGADGQFGSLLANLQCVRFPMDTLRTVRRL